MSSLNQTHFKFKDDPVEAVLIELLNKKAVNSDHFSLVKRIKLAEYLKNPTSQGNIDTAARRSKEYMGSIGFSYGRLKEKNWVANTQRQDLPHMFIPGPTIKSQSVSDQASSPPDLPHPKPLVGFQKVKPLRISSLSMPPTTLSQPHTSRPYTRISASQRQAHEYLNYLNALSGSEQAFITNQIKQKKLEISEKIEKSAKRIEEKFNLKGIFPEEINKERTLSMLPVKMLSQTKICLEPMIRNAKEIVMKEKIKEWQVDPDGEFREMEAITSREVRKSKAFKAVEMTITKRLQKGKKKEVVDPGAKKEKLNWVDRLNQSMNETVSNTRPDELMFIV